MRSLSSSLIANLDYLTGQIQEYTANPFEEDEPPSSSWPARVIELQSQPSDPRSHYKRLRLSEADTQDRAVLSPNLESRSSVHHDEVHPQEEQEPFTTSKASAPVPPQDILPPPPPPGRGSVLTVEVAQSSSTSSSKGSHQGSTKGKGKGATGKDSDSKPKRDGPPKKNKGRKRVLRQIEFIAARREGGAPDFSKLSR